MSAENDWIIPLYSQLTDYGIVSVTVSGQLVNVSFESGRSVIVGIVGGLKYRVADITPLVQSGAEFIVASRNDGVFDRSAISACQAADVGWGNVGDSMRALRLESLRKSIPRVYDFVIPGLERHSHVSSVSFEDSRRLRVDRNRSLGPLILYIEPSYQAEVATVHFALGNCTPFDIFLATDPNSGPTTAALAAARQAGVEIMRWGDIYPRLRR